MPNRGAGGREEDGRENTRPPFYSCTPRAGAPRHLPPGVHAAPDSMHMRVSSPDSVHTHVSSRVLSVGRRLCSHPRCLVLGSALSSPCPLPAHPAVTEILVNIGY